MNGSQNFVKRNCWGGEIPREILAGLLRCCPQFVLYLTSSLLPKVHFELYMLYVPEAVR